MIKSVPIISQDLRQDEVCIRAIRCFQSLDESIEKVFNKVDERISKNLQRLDNISQRLEAASAKIEGLKDSKKAIRIYSPAKYPVQLAKFIPTFQRDQNNESAIDFNYHIKASPTEGVELKKYADKLQFYHLKRAQRQASQKPSLVFTTKSVNSLITFINNENILLNESTTKLRSKENAPASNVTARSDETDFSRFSTLLRSKQDSENFHYFPGMNQAPEIELPMDLPDLPGIADDISFNIPSQDLIVPSLAKMNIINELPNVMDLIEAESNKKLQEQKVQVKAAEPSSSIPQKSVQPTTSTSAPPPPPPPPIPIAIAASIPLPPPIPNIEKAMPKVAQAPPPAGDDRSSLMQAIRNAGGKNKLKSIAAADEVEVASTKPKAKAPPAGDFMADLHAKIALRRQGIAGTKEAKKEKVSLMDKVSLLIPPPTESGSDSSKSDEDWD